MEKEAHKHQADHLQQLFQEIRQHEMQSVDESDQQMLDEPTEQINVLNLPPRKDVHREHKKRTKLKLSQPIKRLLLVIFILALVSCMKFFWLGN